MEKHKFGITCLDMLFLESVLVPTETEKYCVDVLCPGHTTMHYVTCLDVLFLEAIPVTPKPEK
jgi:hypothetical protein